MKKLPVRKPNPDVTSPEHIMRTRRAKITHRWSSPKLGRLKDENTSNILRAIIPAQKISGSDADLFKFACHEDDWALYISWSLKLNMTDCIALSDIKPRIFDKIMVTSQKRVGTSHYTAKRTEGWTSYRQT